MSFLEYTGTHPRAKWGISPSHPSPSFSGEARKKCFHLNFNLPWSFSDTLIAHEEEQFLSGWADAAHFLLHIFSSSSRIYLPQFSIDAGYLLLNQQGDKLFNRQAKTTDSGEQRDSEKAGSGRLRRKITIFYVFFCFDFYLALLLLSVTSQDDPFSVDSLAGRNCRYPLFETKCKHVPKYVSDLCTLHIIYSSFPKLKAHRSPTDAFRTSSRESKQMVRNFSLTTHNFLVSIWISYSHCLHRAVQIRWVFLNI